MKYIIITFFTAFLFSCSQSYKIDEIKIKEIQPLKSILIQSIPPSCYKDAILKDSLFILLNECGDKLFQIYNNRSYYLVNEFGKEGRGPLEFLYPAFINDIYRSNVLLIHDMVHSKISEITLTGNTFTNKDYQLPRKLIRTCNVNKIDSNYIATSLTTESDSALFFIYNPTSKKNINIPYLPKFKLTTTNNPLIDKRTIYSNNIRVAPGKNSIVVAFKYLNLINFYNLQGDLKKSCAIKDIIAPIDSRTIDISENTMVTFYYMYATTDFCYLLWKGAPIECDETKIKSKIFVFDWEGNLCQTYELPHRAQFLVVDEKQAKFLGGVFSEEKEFVEIFEYNYHEMDSITTNHFYN